MIFILNRINDLLSLRQFLMFVLLLIGNYDDTVCMVIFSEVNMYIQFVFVNILFVFIICIEIYSILSELIG